MTSSDHYYQHRARAWQSMLKDDSLLGTTIATILGLGETSRGHSLLSPNALESAGAGDARNHHKHESVDNQGIAWGTIGAIGERLDHMQVVSCRKLPLDWRPAADC